MKEVRLLYSREEMLNINKQTLKERGVDVEDIAVIAYNQQSKYTPEVSNNILNRAFE